MYLRKEIRKTSSFHSLCLTWLTASKEVSRFGYINYVRTGTSTHTFAILNVDEFREWLAHNQNFVYVQPPV
ncbi:hypothetical protein AWB78_06982 [Caballeronia calidae]|uniref:Uncharacterized protein n=1 Tax=Caballeronia calidae TaxID=1777139 RepID=A0A158EF13_9BURK|nr:hypothetical protein AWB78_06982 [Caballeronia calidae]